MKLASELSFEGDSLVIKNTYSATSALQKAKQLRDAGKTDLGESKCVGVIPGALIAAECKKRGVKWSDIHARQEVLKDMMHSRQYQHFRVWEGRY